jgi:uncharacterized protein (TIGR02611 family)
MGMPPAVAFAKRIAIAIIGSTVLVMGIVMLVIPGPGIAGVLAGLGILAIEFTWARVWLQKLRDRTRGVARSLSARRRERGGPPGAS